MDVKICREEAENELERILDAYQAEPSAEGWLPNRELIIKNIMRGNILFDESALEITMTLLKPITLENGDVIKDITMSEPSAEDLSVTDKYKESEKMKQTIAIAARITGKPIGIINRMAARDVMNIGALFSIFF